MSCRDVRRLVEDDAAIVVLGEDAIEDDDVEMEARVEGRTDTAIAANLTRDDTASTAGCVAFVALLLSLLDLDEPPSRDWWIDTFTYVLRQLETDGTYEPRKPGWSSPGRWIDGLAGRTGEDDDGAVFRLIEEGLRKWLVARRV